MENSETTTSNTASKNTLTVNEGKTTAVIAYITIIGLVIAFIMNNEKKNEFASYHIRQSLGLALTGFVLGIVGMIPILGWLVNLIGIFVLLYMWIMGLVNALNERVTPVPFIGKKYEDWFKNI